MPTEGLLGRKIKMRTASSGGSVLCSTKPSSWPANQIYPCHTSKIRHCYAIAYPEPQSQRQLHKAFLRNSLVADLQNPKNYGYSARGLGNSWDPRRSSRTCGLSAGYLCKKDTATRLSSLLFLRNFREIEISYVALERWCCLLRFSSIPRCYVTVTTIHGQTSLPLTGSQILHLP